MHLFDVFLSKMMKILTSNTHYLPVVFFSGWFKKGKAKVSINGRPVDADVNQVRGDGKEYEYHIKHNGTTLGEIHFTEEEDSIIIRHLHNSSRNMQTSDRLPGDCYDGVGAALINILKSGKKKIVALCCIYDVITIKHCKKCF